MKRVFTLLVGLLGSTWSCGAGSAGSVEPAPAPQPARDADSFSAHGLTVERPAGWEFITSVPDASVAPDTFVVIQGPFGEHTLAPVVEISRRELAVADRRRNPEHILQALVSEMLQTVEGFETTAGPQPAEVGGRAGASISITFTEGLPDGGSVGRSARFYGVVVGDGMFIIRCIGPQDGSADRTFDAVIGSISIGS